MASEADLEAAINAAKLAFQTWQHATDTARATACRNMAAVIEAHAEELSQLSTKRLVELINQVLPAGVVTVITCNKDVAALLTTHSDVAKVSFTGSTPTGCKIMAGAAHSLKRLTLELGGNDAEIILPGADPRAIAEGSVWGADIAIARAVASRVECGSVWINKHGAIQPNAPFGGVKQSGFGVEFGAEGLKEFTTIQTVFC